MSEEAPTSFTLYVSNLGFNVDHYAFEAFISEVAKPKDIRIPKNRKRDGKGFAFLEMENEEVAREVIEKLSGKEFDGQIITIEVAKNQTPRPRSDGGRRRDGRDRRRRDRDRRGRSPPRRRRYDDYYSDDEYDRPRYRSRRRKYDDDYSDYDSPRRRRSPPRRRDNGRRRVRAHRYSDSESN